VILALTGATGFVGGQLLDRAVGAGHAVRALARRRQADRPAVEWVIGDLDDAAALERLVAGVDGVVHVAAAVNAADRAGFERANVTGTANLLAAIGPGRRLVHVSSLAAREPGLSDYGWSKAGAEDAVRGSAADWTIVRPPAVYGPGDLELLEVFRAAARARIVPLPPAGRASYLHVADLAQLLLRLAGERGQADTMEPDDGRPLSHPDMARAIGRAVGHRVLPLPLPAALLRTGAVLDRRLRGSRAKLTADRVGYLLHPDWVSNPALAPSPDLWRAAIPQEAGFADTARWYRARALL